MGRSNAAANTAVLDIPTAYKRWLDGESSKPLKELTGLGKALRRAFKKQAGSKEAWKKAEAAHKAAKVQRRPRRVQTADGDTAVVMDDSKVPVITSALVKDGWRTYTKVIGQQYPTVTVIVAPDGKQYVKAEKHERADLLMAASPKYGLPVGRFRLLEGSESDNTLRLNAARVQQHKDAKKERRAARQARREAAGEDAEEKEEEVEPQDAAPKKTKHVKRKR